MERGTRASASVSQPRSGLLIQLGLHGLDLLEDSGFRGIDASVESVLGTGLDALLELIQPSWRHR